MDALEALGSPIHVEEVRDSPGAKALVRSRVEIPWHTDHHRAERIVWYCLQQAEGGGETLLVDAHAALATIDTTHRSALTGVLLHEHSVFRGDGTQHPVLTAGADGRDRVYFSLWMADGVADEKGRAALTAFARAIERVPPVRLRLEAGDILAIDNTRMLHARTEISGSRARHLRRYWLASS